MYTLNSKGRLLVVEKPQVMGILNITPDSFYEGSRIPADKVVEIAAQMVAEGADMLDIGGQSTRPGSARIGASEEAARVLPAIEAIRNAGLQVLISIDTYHSRVAKQAVLAGADMVNDISGGLMDEKMLPTVAALHVPYCCMHMKGVPESMQQQPQYHNLLVEIYDYFINRLEACRLAGIHDVIIDPGVGFGKSIEHNFILLNNLKALKLLGKPMLLGVSRKSFIWKSLQSSAAEALNGTTFFNTVGLMQGADILRVHDVKEAAECVKLFLLLKEKSSMA